MYSWFPLSMELLFGEPFSQADLPTSDSTTQIRERLGNEYHISYGTVRKYFIYACKSARAAQC